VHRTCSVNRFGTRSKVLTFNFPARRNRFGDQNCTFNDECTFVVTRTAAPRKAPQSLNT
jgi:hypothetical protein